MGNFDAIVGRLDAAGVKPAQTLIGVARLALPDFMIEIEATAAA
jgi:enamine deaminase RidA (YjgF/YER057c/UK114 family)